jgi:hypothetical protein
LERELMTSPHTRLTSSSQRVSDFLAKKTARGRIAFIIDATGSREQTWDTAAQLQAEMFSEAAKLGGLEMQVTYFRGLDEVRSSNWTDDARELQHFMGRIRCDYGHTKYARALAHVREEHRRQAINAVILIGDMLEEAPQTLYDSIAGLGVPCFCFQEGSDVQSREGFKELWEAFREVARLTKGAYCVFDAGSIAQLRELLRAVAAFAAGGMTALADLRTDGAAKLLGQMKK